MAVSGTIVKPAGTMPVDRVSLEVSTFGLHHTEPSPA